MTVSPQEDAVTPAVSFSDVLAVCTLQRTDASTLRLAFDLARTSGAKLSVLAVTDQLVEIEQLARFTGVAYDVVYRQVVDDQRAQLTALIERIAEDVPVELDVRIGKPFLEVIRRVLANGHDMVIKTAEDFEGIHRYLFTSTDQHLLRKCPCPVWLALPDAHRPARVVLAAVDVNELAVGEPDTEAALNDEIIQTAGRIAAFDNAPLHLIHVWEAPGEGLASRWSTADGMAERYVRDVEAQHRRALNALVDGLKDRLNDDAETELRITGHLARGLPRTVIPELVRALGADVLVMGTIARTGVPGVIIGNTAEDVLNSVECSVVTVKPPGYVSPVAS